jgi:hypothetical protein
MLERVIADRVFAEVVVTFLPNVLEISRTA